jgi:hypothetical protein
MLGFAALNPTYGVLFLPTLSPHGEEARSAVSNHEADADRRDRSST